MKLEERHRELVEQHRGLVTSLAEKYANRGLSLDALVEAGNVGLAKAAEQFEPTRGYKFSTYATWWVREAMTSAIAEKVVPKEEVAARERVVSVHLEEQTRQVLATLTPPEEAILRQRFGIGAPSANEADQDFEAARERIRAIERKALAKLEHRETEEDARMNVRTLIAALGQEKRDRLRKHVKANRDPAKQLEIPRALASMSRAALKKLILEELDRADDDRL